LARRFIYICTRICYVSENYNTAFNEDYNTGLDFTTTFTTGDEGSGIGTVTIDANYANALH
jgi:hypothetical protein